MILFVALLLPPRGPHRSRPPGPQVPGAAGPDPAAVGDRPRRAGPGGRADRRVRRPRHHEPAPPHARPADRDRSCSRSCRSRAGPGRSRSRRSRSSGVGAFAMAEVAGDAESWLGAGNPLGLLVAAAAAVPFGVLMALPALRLQGLYLALGVDGVRGDGDPAVLRPARDLRRSGRKPRDATLLRDRVRRRAQLPRPRPRSCSRSSVSSSCGCAAARSGGGWSRPRQPGR